MGLQRLIRRIPIPRGNCRDDLIMFVQRHRITAFRRK